MKHEESKLQIACVNWFRYVYPQHKLLLFSVPNGGQRTRINARILKAEGTIAGVSDLILMVARKGYHSLCIEMKIKPNKQTENQKQWQQAVERENNKYVVCHTFEEFEDVINDYLEKT